MQFCEKIPHQTLQKIYILKKVSFSLTREPAMFKKILLATSLAISSSFATLNFFPVGKAHQGQVDLVSVYVWNDDFSTLLFPLSVKYNVIDNFELSLQKIGYVAWSEPKNCEDLPQGCPESSGFTAMTVGARYQFMPTQPFTPIFAGAVDVYIPLSDKDVNNGYDPFGFYGALQYIQIFSRELIFGSELGMKWLFEDECKERGVDVKKEEGVQMTAKGELDYSFTAIRVTTWVGIEFNKKFTEDKLNGEDNGGDESQIDFRVGASYKFSPMFMLKLNFAYSKGDLDGDHKTVNSIFSVMF